MNGLQVGTTPKNFAVLPFYATGALFFLLLSLLLFLGSSSLLGHYFQPHLLAIVHTAALGWGTMIIFGAAYQLLPVICERNLYSDTLSLASYLLLVSGTVILIQRFWIFYTDKLMIAGGAFVVSAALLYTVNVIKTAQLNKRSTLEKYFLLSSAFWLLITTGIGLLLVINLHKPYFSTDHLQVLKWHAHAGLAGWFLQLITGVSVKLIPMFLLGRSTKGYLLKAAFFLQNLGLIGFLFDQYFFGSSMRTGFYLILVLLGVLSWIYYLRDVFKQRLKRKIEIQMRTTFLSFVSLTVALLLAFAVIYLSDTRWSLLYGTFLFLGWITAIILGKTFKTLPFILWNNYYKKAHGSGKLPMPKDLYNEKLLVYQFWCFLFAFGFLAIGVATKFSLLLKAGAFLWVVLALLYVVNVGKIFFHRPKTSPGPKN